MIENHKEIITYVKLMMSFRTFECEYDVQRTRDEIREYVESVCKVDATVYLFGCRDFDGFSTSRLVDIYIGYRNGIYGKTLEIIIPRG